MGRFILTRLMQAGFVVLGVVLLTFVVLRIVPGDPARLLVPPGTSEDVVDSMRRTLGTDQPLHVQLARFLTGLARGDLGDSFRQDRPVLGLILDHLPATLALAATAMALAVAVAVPLGIAAALRSGSLLDRAVLVFAMAGQSLPNFWIGILLVFAFSIQLGWLPAIGMDGWQSFVLPTVTLALGLIALLARTSRQTMLEVMASGYIRAARAKGVPRHRLITVHALRNACIPLITIIGLQIGFVLGGAFVVELIFNWPGIGLMALQAIQTRDFPVVQGVVIVVATAFVVANLLVDVAYAYVNPRVRRGMET